MKMSAIINSRMGQHHINVQTDGKAKQLRIEPKPSGYGSSVNGGELLLLALATCFCNDIYREAAKRKMNVSGVDVTVTGEFGAEGEPGKNFSYKASVISDAPEIEIEELIKHTDQVAEIQNTLRRGLNIVLD